MSRKLMCRRSFLGNALAGGATFAAASIIMPNEANAAIDIRILQPGDVLFGRRNLADNPDWGYWRHAALWDGNWVIEGGVGLIEQRILATDFRVFESRYGGIMIKRLKWSSTYYGPRMANAANDARRRADRKTSAALVKLSYEAATGRRVSWYTPDHIAAAAEFRQIFFQHRS
jgi:hypothetical protein